MEVEENGCGTEPRIITILSTTTLKGIIKRYNKKQEHEIKSVT